MCHYKINNKENTELVSESRILHLHKIMYSADKKGYPQKERVPFHSYLYK